MTGETAKQLSRKGLTATVLAIVGLALAGTGGFMAALDPGVPRSVIASTTLVGSAALFIAVRLLLGVVVTLLRPTTEPEWSGGTMSDAIEENTGD